MNSSFMEEALLLAKEAFTANEVPVGAVIVKDGKIIASGRNRMKEKKSALAHAELEAISAAMEALGSERLDGCELYVTLEPCPMCAGAIINSRIKTVVFGAFDLKAGSLVSVQQMFNLPYNHKPEIFCGIKEEACAALLSNFFESIRKTEKYNKFSTKNYTISAGLTKYY